MKTRAFVRKRTDTIAAKVILLGETLREEGSGSDAKRVEERALLQRHPFVEKKRRNEVDIIASNVRLMRHRGMREGRQSITDRIFDSEDHDKFRTAASAHVPFGMRGRAGGNGVLSRNTSARVKAMS